MNKNFKKYNKPTPNGFNNHHLFIALGILFIVCSIALDVLSLGLPWFAIAIRFVAKVTMIMGVICLAPSIWKLLTSFLHDVGVKNSKTVNHLDLSMLGTENFKNKLYAMGFYVQDPYNTLKIRFPKIYFTDDGFRIACIGDLEKKLLADTTIAEFNAFLELNNSKAVIRSSYYADGYVCYQVGNSVKSDRLRF